MPTYPFQDLTPMEFDVRIITHDDFPLRSRIPSKSSSTSSITLEPSQSQPLPLPSSIIGKLSEIDLLSKWKDGFEAYRMGESLLQVFEQEGTKLALMQFLGSIKAFDLSHDPDEEMEGGGGGGEGAHRRGGGAGGGGGKETLVRPWDSFDGGEDGDEVVIEDGEDVDDNEEWENVNEEKAGFIGNPSKSIKDGTKTNSNSDDDKRIPYRAQLCKAHYQAGQSLTSGEYMPPDWNRGLYYFQWAAAGGHPDAQFEMGDAYEYGRGGLKMDLEKAVEWYRKAAQSGSVIGMHALSLAYYYGDGVRENVKLSTRIMLEAANRGFELSQMEMGLRCENGDEAIHSIGRLYSEGLGVEQDWAIARSWFDKAVDLDHAPAKVSLGRMYFSGNGGIGKDVKKALGLYRAAAEVNDPDAHYALGMCYFKGEGVEKDLNEALKYLVRASNMGQSKAQCELAKCYLKGVEGVCEANPKEAFTLFEMSAQEGHVAEAQYYLGIFYNSGGGAISVGAGGTGGGSGGGEPETGRSKDTKKALKYFKLAANQGHAKAMAQVGNFLMWGKGGAKKNYVEAAFWLNEAAKLGDAWGACNYAKLLDAGLGVKQDSEKAQSIVGEIAGRGLDVMQYGWKAVVKNDEALDAQSLSYGDHSRVFYQRLTNF
ncbi:Protein sel-1 1 [Blyttiomyces sp. JEL0837]|nr:Protein sel-1 1 [Blyttiomyces sp. JEL0837]